MATSQSGGLKTIAVGRSDIHKVDPRKLFVKPGWNGRDMDDPENLEYIEELALSIAENGVQQPLTCMWENGKAWVTDGHMRLRATLLAIERGAEVVAIPIKAEERYGNEADRVFSQIVRNSGKRFSAMEQARIYKRLLDMGWQVTDIATKSGVSISRVSQMLSLLNLPEEVKHMVTSGQVSASLARQTMAEYKTDDEGVKTLQDGIVLAKKKGKNRVTKRFLNNGGTDEDEHPIIEGIPFDQNTVDAAIDAEKKKARRLDIEKAVIEAFEYAHVDEECVNDKGKSVVVVTFPADQFEKIRQACRL
jgi:ParB family transcriptional regulator, chromosome partitioning protein